MGKRYPTFMALLKALELPEPVFEYKFHHVRKWRIDIAWPKYKLALEIEGGVWTNGRHNRPGGYLKDMEKYNALAIAGFYLLRTIPEEIQTGEAINIVAEWFKENSP
jgi:very-short-patch-repair endonuclease